MEWDDTNERKWGRFLRLRARVDLTKPLRRGAMTLTGPGKTIKVFFKYERLLDYCYLYGHLGHSIRDCDKHIDEDDEEEDPPSNYGSWLRASPFKKTQTQLTVTHQPTSMKKLIFKPNDTDTSSSNNDHNAFERTRPTGDSAGGDSGSPNLQKR